jgi:hypothetical protein
MDRALDAAQLLDTADVYGQIRVAPLSRSSVVCAGSRCQAGHLATKLYRRWARPERGGLSVIKIREAREGSSGG